MLQRVGFDRLVLHVKSHRPRVVMFLEALETISREGATKIGESMMFCTLLKASLGTDTIVNDSICYGFCVLVGFEDGPVTGFHRGFRRNVAFFRYFAYI